MYRSGNVDRRSTMEWRRIVSSYDESVSSVFVHQEFTIHDHLYQLFQHKTPPPVPSDIVLSEAALDFRRQCFQMYGLPNSSLDLLLK